MDRFISVPPPSKGCAIWREGDGTTPDPVLHREAAPLTSGACLLNLDDFVPKTEGECLAVFREGVSGDSVEAANLLARADLKKGKTVTVRSGCHALPIGEKADR